MSSAGLELKGLSKNYGKSRVVDNLSLSIRDGELLVLVGPSGSGKSTLLRLIAGLIAHDAGEIEIAGRAVGHLPPDQRDVAMVFQSYALFPHMSIFDNLAFGMRARGEPAAHIATRIASVAEGLGLGAMLQRFPRQLSGGERQRVALGRAMLREPKLFLMDEPLSNLDAQLRVQTRAEILRLHARLKTTTIYVTHDQIEALSMGDRIGVLRGGKLEQIGNPREIYQNPANLFVARFIGSPPMNTFPVRVGAGQGLHWKSAVIPIPAALAEKLGDSGREVVLGVRPENVYLAGSRWAVGERPAHAISATVDIVESAGDQIFLVLDVEGDSIIARAEPEFAIARGDVVDIWFQPDALHLFDPQTELAIGSSR